MAQKSDRTTVDKNGKRTLRPPTCPYIAGQPDLVSEKCSLTQYRVCQCRAVPDRSDTVLEVDLRDWKQRSRLG